jgi:Ran GTPase-activating protein (RanGAP) involved in mRNA processing and transport
LMYIDLSSNGLGDISAERISEAIKCNISIRHICISSNCIGCNFITEVKIQLEECRLRKKNSDRTLICAFFEKQKDLLQLRFDKMILDFICYPFLEATSEQE